MLDDVPAFANPVCLLALSRSDRHVLGFLLRAGLIALCCSVLCLRQMFDDSICSYLQPKVHKHEKKWKKRALLKKRGKKKRRKGSNSLAFWTLSRKD